MKKIFLFALAAVMLIAPAVWAQTMTQEQLMAEISRLTALLSQLQNATTTPTACPATFTRDLVVGSYGEDVVKLHNFLTSKGYGSFNSGDDGRGLYNFTEETAVALVKYQAAVGISPASGYFGPVTRANLNAALGCENKNDIWISASKYQVKSGESFQFVFKFPETASYGEFLYRCNGNDLELNAKGGAFCGEKSRIEAPFTERIVSSVTATLKNTSAKVELGGEVFAYNKEGKLIGKAIVWVVVGPGGASEPSITVLSPNGGESYKMGDTLNVEWRANDLDKVNIYLFRDNGGCSIATPSATGSEFSFRLNESVGACSNIAPGKYKIHIAKFTDTVTGGSDWNVEDYSDSEFTITSATAAPLTILTPKENETYDVGDKLKISWTPKKAEIKQIALICSGTCSSDYLVYQPRSSWFRTSSGVRNYRIPRDNFQPGYYRVRITLNDGTIAESSIIRILGEDEEVEEEDIPVVTPCANAPYQTKNAAGRCVWTCGAGTTPSNTTGKCVCEAGLSAGATDSRGRLTCAAPLTRDQARPTPISTTEDTRQLSDIIGTPTTGSVCATGVNSWQWKTENSSATRDYCSESKSEGWAVRCLKAPGITATMRNNSGPGFTGDAVCTTYGEVCAEVNAAGWGVQPYCSDLLPSGGYAIRCLKGQNLSAFQTNNEAGVSGDNTCKVRGAECVSVNNNLGQHLYCSDTIPEAGWSVRCVKGEGVLGYNDFTTSAKPSGDAKCGQSSAAAPSRARQTASIFQAIGSFFGLFGGR
jgi:hypothetical protein